MEAKAIVIDTLKKAGKPLKSAEIADLAGIDKKEVDKALKTLKTEDKVFSPKVCFYQTK
jgi:predicted transcriptional regulator